MRSFLLLLAFACLAGMVRADIPVPQPSNFTLSGAEKFPQYLFTYVVGTRAPQPVAAGKTYPIEDETRLFVQEGKGKPQEFATLKPEYRGVGFKITVQGVEGAGDALKVNRKVAKENLPPRSGRVRRPGASNSTSSPAWPYFLLAGVSAGALWVRRGKLA